ncbi:MAG: aconitate hydratase [Candidatus Bathyarchaeota archaeon]
MVEVRTLTEKLIESHLLEGSMAPGDEMGVRIDHTLIQDSLGTLAALEFEAMKVPRVATELSVCFVDHNTLQDDYRNADDHVYLAGFSAKHGLVYSRPGNGICHQVFLERFAAPGKTLLGADSHTPTAGAVGCLSIGAGGLDVAAAMAGEPFYFEAPRVVGVELVGRLTPFVSAKDIALEVLRRVGVSGGVGKALEYTGPGVEGLSVPERGTIANMGAETGATTSIFPSDQATWRFLEAQGRPDAWAELKSDEGAKYHERLSIDLGELEPLIALPHSPGNVRKVAEVQGLAIDQVCVGSCTNSSLSDLRVVARLLRGRTIHPRVSLTVSPGSKQVLSHLAAGGELKTIIESGARLLECVCGPCIGMGQAPPTGSVSLRTFNRNFRGRSGTPSAKVYLCSPETAVASAVTGVITDPRSLGEYPELVDPGRFNVNDGLLVWPSKTPDEVQIIRGPNIRPLPEFKPLPATLEGEVLLRLGDDVTTDDIIAGGAKVLPLRSNIPEISRHVFEQIDPGFHGRAAEKGGGFLVAGANYGQGSSREHAALAPKYLGVHAIIAVSFARIHKSNLVNFGVMPLEFRDDAGYTRIGQGDRLLIDAGDPRDVRLVNVSRGLEVAVKLDVGQRARETLMGGGRLVYIREKTRR